MRTEIYRVEVPVTVDAKYEDTLNKLTAALKNVDEAASKASKGTSAQAKATESAAKSNKAAADEAKRATEETKRSGEASEQSARKLKMSASSAKAMADNYKKASEAVKKSNDDIVKSTEALERTRARAARSPQENRTQLSAGKRMIDQINKMRSAAMRLNNVNANIVVGIRDRASAGLTRIKSMYNSFRSNPAVRITVGVVDRAMRGLNMIRRSILSIPTAITVAVGFIAGKAAGEATIGAAAGWERYEVSMKHWLDGNEEQAKALTTWMGQFADSTPFSSPELFPALTTAISMADKNLNKAKRLTSIAANMSALTPGTTPEEAMMAIFNTSMGNTEMLKGYGLNIGVKQMEAMGGFDGVVNELEKTFDGGAAALAKTASGIWATLQGYRGSFMRAIGTGLLEPIKPRLMSISNWLDNNQELWGQWKNAATNAASEATEGILKNFGGLGQYMKELFVDGKIPKTQLLAEEVMNDVLGDRPKITLGGVDFGIGSLNDVEMPELTLKAKLDILWQDTKAKFNEHVTPVLSAWWEETGRPVMLNIATEIGVAIAKGIKQGAVEGFNVFTGTWGKVGESVEQNGLFSSETLKSTLVAGGATLAGGGLLLAGGVKGGKMIKGLYDTTKGLGKAGIDKVKDIFHVPGAAPTPKPTTKPQPMPKPTVGPTSQPLIPTTTPTNKTYPHRQTPIPQTAPKIDYTKIRPPKQPNAKVLPTQTLSKFDKFVKKLPVIGAVASTLGVVAAEDKIRAGAETLGNIGGWAGGAAAGAAIGSVVPVIGTGVGAFVGGVAGSLTGGWLGGKTIDKGREIKDRATPLAAESMDVSTIDTAVAGYRYVNPNVPENPIGVPPNLSGVGDGLLDTTVLGRSVEALTMHLSDTTLRISESFNPVISGAETLSTSIDALARGLDESVTGLDGVFTPMKAAGETVVHNLTALTTTLAESTVTTVEMFTSISASATVLDRSLIALTTHTSESAVSMATTFMPITSSGAVLNTSLIALTYHASSSAVIVATTFGAIQSSGTAVLGGLNRMAGNANMAAGAIASVGTIASGVSGVNFALNNLAARISAVNVASVGSGGGGNGPIKRPGIGVTPYANGGLITKPHLALAGEAGAEMIIPLSAQRRSRAIELYQQTGNILGVTPYADGGLAGAATNASVGSGGGGNGGGASIEVVIENVEVSQALTVDEIAMELAVKIKESLNNRGVAVK